VAIVKTKKPDYGVDAPHVLRNLFLIGTACLLLGIFGPRQIHFGQVIFLPRPMLFWTGTLLLLEGLLFLFYVKVGKYYHRDRMLSLRKCRGDEQVLAVAAACCWREQQNYWSTEEKPLASISGPTWTWAAIPKPPRFTTWNWKGSAIAARY